MKAALILLAGGKGTRMGGTIPKQFLPLNDLIVSWHSLKVFNQVKAIVESVIVVDPEYQHLFPGYSYALPGNRRQDSVWNGLRALGSSIDLVCIHDAARPFITVAMVENVLAQAGLTGAAALGMPLKFTVKEVNAQGLVQTTLDRSSIWEIQTPQVVKRDLLHKGFSIAFDKNLTVTDDVGLVELFGHPVQLVAGSYQNLKLTTEEDLLMAKAILRGNCGL